MNNPVWIDERGKIIEPEYCRDFLSRHPIRCINDRFYTVEGPLPEKNRSSFLYLMVWLGIKIGYTQSTVVQTVKNTTINRTQIIIP